MKFNPARLSVARKRRMLNKKAFADLVATDPTTVTRWEGAQQVPTPESVEMFARELKFPVEFFYRADIQEPCSETTSFRSQTSMSASERDAALAAGQIGFLISDWVTERFDLPTVKLPNLHLYDPEEAAVVLRQEWGLGEKPIANMIQLLESKGVRVFSLAENTAHVNAYSLWRRETPFVFLNNFKSAECSRFDAAHELAHLVLHQDGNMKGRPAEDQANKFASSFLMPRADVLSVFPKVSHLQQLISRKQRWRVSLAAITYRAHKLGIISDWKYRDFCIEIATKGYNKSEPDGIPREKSVVWEKVLQAMWREKTTHLDIADELSIPASELSDLLFGVLNSPNSIAGTPPTPLTVVPRSKEEKVKYLA